MNALPLRIEAQAPRLADRMPLILGLAGLSSLVLTALAAPILTGTGALAIDPAAALAPPGARHWLGTDAAGRDLLAVEFRSAARAVLVGGTVTSLVLVGAVAIGLLGWLDRRIDRAIAIVSRAGGYFPGLILAAIVSGGLGRGLGPECLALSLMLLPGTVAELDAMVGASRRGFLIDGAKAIGLRPRAILWRYVLPPIWAGVAGRVAVVFTASVAAEAALSFLGLGADSGQSSWGTTLAEARLVLHKAWWLLVVPGSALTLTLLAGLLAGQALDPGAAAATDGAPGSPPR